VDDRIKIVECPRDAWQGLPAQIPPEVKAEYLGKLIGAGFTHIDAVSFVSPAAVPQMADSEQVLALLNPAENVEIIAIVVNEKGAERAVRSGVAATLGFPFSISPEFLRRNQNQTPEQALGVLKAIAKLGQGAGLEMVAYLSMAFGNPYGDAWSIDAVTDACRLLVGCGVRQISVADTVGLASPGKIAETLAAVLSQFCAIEIGVHLHARRGEAGAHIRAAFDAGCRRFDAAIGGLGGCPFAQDALVGNIPTEVLISELTKCGATLPALGPLEELIRANAEIESNFGTVAK